MRKVWLITRQDLFTFFTDHNLLLINIGTPLIIALIFGFAFSDVGKSESPAEIEPLPVAVVNLDEGDAETGMNLGRQYFVETFQSSDRKRPGLWIAATFLTSREEAIAAVDNGDYDAAIVIPAGFTRAASYSLANGFFGEPVAIEVYQISDSAFYGSVIPAIVEGIINDINGMQAALGATMTGVITLAETNQEIAATVAGGTVTRDFGRAFGQHPDVIDLVPQPFVGDIAHTEETAGGFNYIIEIGAAQALMFAMFMATSVAGNVLREHKQGTLQRMLLSSVSRFQVFTAKMIGSYLTILLQLVIIFVGFLVINWLTSGSFTMLWGDNIVALAVLLLVMAVPMSGVGMFGAALARNVEQVQAITGLPILIMALAGGGFGFSLGSSWIADLLTNISLVHWGSDGLLKLAADNSAVGSNLLVLGAVGAALFWISFLLFRRREF